MITSVNTDMVDNSPAWSYTSAKVQLAIVLKTNTQETCYTLLLFSPELLCTPMNTQKQTAKGLVHRTPCCH